MENLKFELLALDTGDASPIQSEINLLHSLMGNGTLLKNATLDQVHTKISDEGLTLSVQLVKGDPDLGAALNKAFLVTLVGRENALEPLREGIAAHLKQQNFERLYILTDEVSEKIACEIYPLIYKVENLLRGYLIKFMTTRLGPLWWENTATSELNKKIHLRKNNEQVFAQHIDNSAYLIDFGDLGQIIYTHSSGFTSKEDIIKKISEVEETPEAIRALKQHLQSNYQRFFKDTFKDKGFQAKWESLEKLRHKVAHNNLFTGSDLHHAQEIANELMGIIEEATKAVDAITLGAEDKEAIKDSLVDRGFFAVISDEQFLEELRSAESYFARNNGFVGLTHFVRRHLGDKGFDFRASFEIASRLSKQGRVEVYKVKNPHEDYPTSAIRIATDIELTPSVSPETNGQSILKAAEAAGSKV
ncbi:MAG: hypothetical protein AABN95_20560 [Acidobacteriota bacterium]